MLKVSKRIKVAQEPGTQSFFQASLAGSSSPTGHLLLPSQAGPEVGQPGLKLAPLWDAGRAGSGLYPLHQNADPTCFLSQITSVYHLWQALQRPGSSYYQGNGQRREKHNSLKHNLKNSHIHVQFVSKSHWPQLQLPKDKENSSAEISHHSIWKSDPF